MMSSSQQGLRIPALKVRQNEHDIYSVDLTADMLMQHTQVDKWTHTPVPSSPTEQGYQREELKSHYSKVGSYLATNRNAILPTSILLSVRGEVKFEPIAGSESMGYLTIPEAALPLWLVDGQHRVAGLRYAIEELGKEEKRNFTLPAVIMANMPKFDEVQQFYLVNSTSKRIKTDLAEQLLTEMMEVNSQVRADMVGKGKAWLPRAVKVSEALNERAGSPWEGRIQRPNSQKIGEVMITASSFNESLKPILSISWITKMSDDNLIEIINRYWLAICGYMPEAFEAPKEFSLQKTVGTYTWHMVAPTVFEVCRSKQNNFAVEHIKQILKPLEQEYLDSDFWAVGGAAAQYSSRAGFQILSDDMLRALPNTDDELSLDLN
jgi:DGQHR domain-containing protein